MGFLINNAVLQLQMRVRSLARRMGLIPVLHRVRRLWMSDDYEHNFSSVMMKSLRSSDCVWDVGANVGFYTAQFASRCSHVVAFEPVPDNVQKIPALPNVTVLPVALSAENGTGTIYAKGPYSSLVGPMVPASRSLDINLMRGDDVAAPAPSIVKIDVEGYELEVLNGMRNTLRGARAVFLEVHFSVLDKPGNRNAPAEIISVLRSAGFSHITWPDASHVAAFRNVD